MKYNGYFPMALAAFLVVPGAQAAQQTDKDGLAALHSLAADRRDVVTHELQLTDFEAKSFWPASLALSIEKR